MHVHLQTSKCELDPEWVARHWGTSGHERQHPNVCANVRASNFLSTTKLEKHSISETHQSWSTKLVYRQWRIKSHKRTSKWPKTFVHWIYVFGRHFKAQINTLAFFLSTSLHYKMRLLLLYQQCACEVLGKACTLSERCLVRQQLYLLHTHWQQHKKKTWWNHYRSQVNRFQSNSELENTNTMFVAFPLENVVRCFFRYKLLLCLIYLKARPILLHGVDICITNTKNPPIVINQVSHILLMAFAYIYRKRHASWACIIILRTNQCKALSIFPIGIMHGWQMNSLSQ